jgi:hypothetical protein
VFPIDSLASTPVVSKPGGVPHAKAVDEFAVRRVHFAKIGDANARTGWVFAFLGTLGGSANCCSCREIRIIRAHAGMTVMSAKNKMVGRTSHAA